ncbi:hypothetical protein BH09DEP1_BH09DEP1_8480 [soil metagenome]
MINSYIERLKMRIKSTHNKVKDYWTRSLNTSNRNKGSEGLQQSNKLRTVAHKDQWRKNKKSE